MTDSVISEELRRRLRNCMRTAGQEYRCEVDFDPAFRGFEGHFEGQPIVPGVCLIELARVHAENVLGSSLHTEEIDQCRFRSPILAGMKADCKLLIRDLDDTRVKIQAEIRTGGNIACQVRLKGRTA